TRLLIRETKNVSDRHFLRLWVGGPLGYDPILRANREPFEASKVAAVLAVVVADADAGAPAADDYMELFAADRDQVRWTGVTGLQPFPISAALASGEPEHASVRDFVRPLVQPEQSRVGKPAVLRLALGFMRCPPLLNGYVVGGGSEQQQREPHAS